jgi:transcriptional regulator with XRE-family HTH domain
MEPGNPGDDAVGGEGAQVHRLPVGEAGADAGRTVGAELRAARERAGLTLAEVAQATKVRPGILKEIEADAHDRLPALTYTLGFVKAYARTVGLDPQAVALLYKRESQKGEPVPSLVDLQPLEERRLPSRGLVVASSAGALLLVSALVLWSFGLFSGPLPPEPVTPDGTSAPTAALPPAPPPAAAPADGPVKLVARDEVWLRVSTAGDGTRFFEGTLAKGQVLDLPAGPEFLLRTGRAGALEVRIGAEVLPPLGGPVEVLRDQPLDAASLRARAAPRAGLADAPPPPA